MKSKELLEIVYEYYPKDLDCVENKIKYINSKEYRNLVSCISVHKNSHLPEIDNLILQLKKVSCNYEFKNSTFFNWQDRCYTFEFFRRSENDTFMIKFHKSILSNLYKLSCYNIVQIGNREKYKALSIINFPDQSVVKSFDKIAANFKLEDFDADLMNKIIDNLTFEDIPFGKFSFFNAFFLSQNI